MIGNSSLEARPMLADHWGNCSRRAPMTYDLFFFTPARGCTTDEINKHLDAVAAEQEEDEDDQRIQTVIDDAEQDATFQDQDEGEDNEDEDDEPLLPEEFVLDRLTHEEFAAVLLKPYLRCFVDNLAELPALVDEPEAIPDVQAWLDSEDVPMPDVCFEIAEDVFDYEIDHGLMPLMLAEGILPTEVIQRLAEMLRQPELLELDIVAFDPQMNMVLGPEDAALMEKAAEISEEDVREFLENLGTADSLYTPSLPDSVRPVLEDLEGPVLIATVANANGKTVETLSIGTVGEALITLEILHSCLRVMREITDSPEPGEMPSPADLSQWVDGLAIPEADFLEEDFDLFLKELGDMLEEPLSTETMFPATIKRLGAFLLIAGDPRGEEKLHTIYLMLRFAHGTLEAYSDIWRAEDESRDSQIKISSSFLESYADACEKTFDSDRTITVSLG